MHEIKIMENVVAILEAEVRSPDVGKVKKVYLEIGKLRYIVPEILETGFRNVPRSEKLQDAELVVETVPVSIRCRACGKVSGVDTMSFRCPSCSADDVEMASGDELKIKGIEW